MYFNCANKKRDATLVRQNVPWQKRKIESQKREGGRNAKNCNPLRPELAMTPVLVYSPHST
jgi:hypothetical protein